MSRPSYRIGPAALIALLALASPARSQCVGTFSDDFSSGSLAPRWTDLSAGVGSASESGGRLVLTKNAGVVGASLARMVSPQQLCGDFDVTVDYDLGTFPAAAAGGGRYHTMILRDRATDALLAGIERYREPANACIPFTDSYKLYTNDPGCTPNAIYVATSDTQGKFRLQRTGTTIHGYWWNGSAWVESMTRSISNVPVYVDFDSGTNGSLATGHTASFDNLVVQSASSMPAASPRGLLVLASGILAAGAIAIRRRGRATA